MIKYANRWTFLKLAVVVLLLSWLPLLVGLPLLLVLTFGYPYVVAKGKDLQPMPAMDLMSFYSGKRSPVNIVSATFMSDSKTDYVRSLFRRLVLQHPKMHSQIVQVFGDLYYKTLDVEKCLDS